MPIVKTRTEAAKILKVTVRTIATWKTEPGFPGRTDRQYDTDAIAAWRESKNEQRSKATVAIEKVSIETKTVKLEILELNRQSKEMDLQKKRGNLFERELVLELLAIITGRVRDAATKLQRSGNTTAAQAINGQMDLAKKLINDRIDAALRNAEK